MSRYNYFLILFIVFFGGSGCATKGNSIVTNIFKTADYELTEGSLEEDRLTIYAIDAYERRDFKNSHKYYKELYYKTDKLMYASRAINSAALVKDFKSVEQILKQVDKNKQRNPEIDRYKIALHVDKKEFKLANKLALDLVDQNASSKNLELAGLSYEGLKEYNKAIKYYKESYQEEKNLYPLLRMFDILYLRLNKREEATKLLETHVALYNCDKVICARLLQHYAYQKDYLGVERILQKLYTKNKHPLYAKKLLHLYNSQQNYTKAIEFLKKTKFDDLLLLNIYTTVKDYKSAFKLAEELYQKNSDPEILARSAILEYESTKHKSKELLNKITKKFEDVVEELNDPLFNNYYGYLLIDHEIDVDKGIQLVKKALKEDPNSHFYIDSIAWGMFKKGDCQGAYTKLKSIAEVNDEQEIQDHFQEINNCIKRAK